MLIDRVESEASPAYSPALEAIASHTRTTATMKQTMPKVTKIHGCVVRPDHEIIVRPPHTSRAARIVLNTRIVSKF